MAYEQTNATSVEDLINKIALFAGNNGWTVHRNNLVTTNRTVTMSKTGDYIHLYNTSTTSGMFVRSSVGYDGGLAATAQPNQSVSVANANVSTGPFSNVFLFSNNDCIFAVVEIASGVFRHLCFGMLQKLGTYTGGTFFEAHNVDTRPGYGPADPWYDWQHPMFASDSASNGNRGGVRCDVDGNTNYFAPFARYDRYTTPVASGAMGNMQNTGAGEHEGRVTLFYNRSINSWSGITPLQPVKIRVERPSGYWSEIGIVPAIRFLNMTRFQAGDEFSIGSDTWKVFPWVRKGYVVNEQYSSELAFAYLKTV